MYSLEAMFGTVVLTVVITSLFWGLIWSISNNDRLKQELRKTKND
jgi:hypothetical protein